eukprot:scaffold14709_cov91-Cyclotella_meneghiniana.AAC.2
MTYSTLNSPVADCCLFACIDTLSTLCAAKRGQEDGGVVDRCWWKCACWFPPLLRQMAVAALNGLTITRMYSRTNDYPGRLVPWPM